jgi:hypothetical protein
MNAHEVIKLYHESMDRKTFVAEISQRMAIEEDEAGWQWELIDAAIESECP